MATRPAAAAGKKITTKATAQKPAPRNQPPRKSAPPPGEIVATIVEPAKQKLVRDSFTMPKTEYDVIAALKARLVHLERPTKKGELIRAGIAALAAMSDAALRVSVERIPSLKTGRPKKVKGEAVKGGRKSAG